MSDINFARTITEIDLGITASGVMTDCEKYGMTYGCNEDCPVLLAGKCELQDSDNKELYERALQMKANGLDKIRNFTDLKNKTKYNIIKEILEDLFKERTIDSGALGREIIFENEFDDMIDEIVKLCNLRIVSKRSELLNAFITAYNAQPKHKRSDTLSVMDADKFLKGVL